MNPNLRDEGYRVSAYLNLIIPSICLNQNVILDKHLRSALKDHLDEYGADDKMCP